jgi:hypothetical protein
MANSNTTPSRLGQINAAGDALALFLKKFAGEVLTTFTTENVFLDKHMVRTIQNGKSAQFPKTGIATAKYHVPGENIADSGNSYLSQIKHDEKVISIDQMLLASSFVAEIDELMNHYDVRSIYSTELGRALAQKFDQNVARVLALGSVESSSVTDGGQVESVSITNKGTSGYVDGGVLTFSGGGATTQATGTIRASGGFVTGVTLLTPGVGYTSAPTATAATGTGATFSVNIVNRRGGSSVATANSTGVEPTGAQIVASLYSAAELLDKKNIPGTDRYCAMGPTEYFKVASASTSESLYNRFYGNGGKLSAVELPEIAGFKITRSNNLPKFNIASATGENNTYAGDFSLLRALCFHKMAAGTVKLKDIAVESEYQIERQGTLLVAKYAMGHGSVRPEGVVAVNRTL